jgi:methylmalonyl-CoA/ethylmalonyl-CoA epimerase
MNCEFKTNALSSLVVESGYASKMVKVDAASRRVRLRRIGMRRCICTTTIAFMLFAISFGLGPLAGAQSDRVGFEISHHHVGISVPNAEESAAWYHKMLGFEIVTKINQGSGMTVVHIKRGNCYIELFQVAGAKTLPEYRRDPSADLKVHGLVHFAFQVADVPAAIKELKSKGAEIAMDAADTPGVAFAFVRDHVQLAGGSIWQSLCGGPDVPGGETGVFISQGKRKSGCELPSRSPRDDGGRLGCTARFCRSEAFEKGRDAKIRCAAAVGSAEVNMMSLII